MTNQMIIMSESLRLMEEGKLKGTGEFVQIEENGEIKEIELPEEIHTFNGWKQRGFAVKKGEKSEIRIEIWKYAKKKAKETDGEQGNDNEEKGRMFMKSAAFFTAAQVEKIQN